MTVSEHNVRGRVIQLNLEAEMIEMSLDEQTKQLEGSVDQMLWDLSILDYRANELKLACKANQIQYGESLTAGPETTNPSMQGAVVH